MYLLLSFSVMQKKFSFVFLVSFECGATLKIWQGYFHGCTILVVKCRTFF